MSVELQDFWYNFIILNLGDLSNLIGCYKTKKKEKKEIVTFGIVFLYFKKVGRKNLDVSARIIRSVS